MKINHFLPGLILVGLITAVSIYLSKILNNALLSSITIAIIIGIIIGNTLYKKHITVYENGVCFAKGRLLKLGIILYGFHITFQNLSDVGTHAIISDLIIVSSTFILSLLLGKYLFRLDNKTTILIGAGSSICGAAAILATDPVAKANGSNVSIAVATVVIYGTIAMFLYPAIYHLDILKISADGFGIYIGSSIHEVAQVYATGASISPDIADIAVTTKMIRVMMLTPFLILLSIFLTATNPNVKHNWKNVTIPWFAILFILVAGFNSLNLLQRDIVDILLKIDNIMLTMAMAALGLSTHFTDLKKAGIKPLLLGLLIFIWLIFIGGLLQMKTILLQ